jgi:hypothetical protein
VKPTENIVSRTFSGCSTLFIVVWIGLWSAGTVFFDYKCVTDLLKQYRTTQFLPAKGRILDSRVDVSSDSDGSSYKPVVHYEYVVDDIVYQSHDLRLGATTSNQATATAWTSRFPTGGTATVYYDPGNPGRAVLMTGVEGVDLFMFIFLLPFNAIAIICLQVAYMTSFRRRPFLLPRSVRIIDDGILTRARLDEAVPLIWGVGTAGALGFAATFILGFAFTFNPPVPVALLVLAAIAGAGTWVYLRNARRVWAGEMDVAIDDRRRAITLPTSDGRAPFVELRQDDLRDVFVDAETTHDSDGDAQHKYHVTLRYRQNDNEATARVTHFRKPEQAEALSEWLKARLRLAQSR